MVTSGEGRRLKLGNSGMLSLWGPLLIHLGKLGFLDSSGLACHED